MVEVACVKAWATNLCIQLKSCADKADKCICAVSKQKGINIGGMCQLLLWVTYCYTIMTQMQSRPDYDTPVRTPPRLQDNSDWMGWEVRDGVSL